MTDIPYRTALIVGAGPGISASVARGLASAGLKVGLAARNVEKLVPLATETGAQTFAVDASDPAGVERLVRRRRQRGSANPMSCSITLLAAPSAWPDCRTRTRSGAESDRDLGVMAGSSSSSRRRGA